MFLTRPPRGSLYLGFHVLEGPVDSKSVTFSYSYWMSPKWVSSFGTSYDFVQGDIGQNLQITRVGESFLISVGVNYDATRGTYGGAIAIEPRFLPRTGCAASTAPDPACGSLRAGIRRRYSCPTLHALPTAVGLKSSRNAFRGVRAGVRGQDSFLVHLPVAAAGRRGRAATADQLRGMGHSGDLHCGRAGRRAVQSRLGIDGQVGHRRSGPNVGNAIRYLGGRSAPDLDRRGRSRHDRLLPIAPEACWAGGKLCSVTDLRLRNTLAGRREPKTVHLSAGEESGLNWDAGSILRCAQNDGPAPQSVQYEYSTLRRVSIQVKG